MTVSVATLLVSVGCSNVTPTDAGTDVLVDVSVADLTTNPDAGMDAASDVGTNAGVDTSADAATDADAEPGTVCARAAEILVTAASDWGTIGEALTLGGPSCADYWVSIAPQAADATMLRGAVEASRLRDLGPHTHALAVLDWTAWTATNPTDWNAVGVSYRREIAATNYNPVDGDTWLVVNVPVTTLGTATGRQNLRNLLHGMYAGPMGFPPLRGGVVLSGAAQTDTDVAAYRTAAEAMLSDATLFTDFGLTTRWLSESVPPAPSAVCIAGASRDTLAAAINAYAENLPRLANAMGAPTVVATAQRYLARAWVPMLNASWDPSSLGATAADGLIATEVYATRTWSDSHGWPGGRIGFGWAPPTSDASADARSVADVLAAAIGGGYAPRTVPASAACVPSLPSGCGCAAIGAAFVPTFSNFDTW